MVLEISPQIARINLRNPCNLRLWLFCVCLLVFAFSFAAFAKEDDFGLDLRSIPIAQWLNAGETDEIAWNLQVGDASLRMDQRLEVLYTARIRAKDLNRAGATHALFLVSRISRPAGEWLNPPMISRQAIEKPLPGNAQVRFDARAFVQPGEYVLWLVLFDRDTGKHNVARRRIRIPEISNDPLPDALTTLPLVEFPQSSGQGNGVLAVSSKLFLPVETKRPLEVELILPISPPEQWTQRQRLVRSYTDNTVGALAALSQMELSQGSISIAGLDLARHEIQFEQRDLHNVDWPALLGAVEKANSPEITAAALEGRKANGAFFREFLSDQLAFGTSSSEPLRVFIVITSSLLFESGSDLTPLQVDGDCNCRVYHLRFRLNVNDVFDQLGNLMKPLRPRTFNLMTPRDLRKAIAVIIEELRNL